MANTTQPVPWMDASNLLTLARAVARRYRAPGLEPADLLHEAITAILAGYEAGITSNGHLINLARQRLRKVCSEAWREDREALAGDPPDRKRPLPSDDLDRVYDLLPPRAAFIVELYYWRDLPDREIAQRIHSTPGAVRTARHRALQLLQSRL